MTMTLPEMVALVADLRGSAARQAAALNDSRQAWEDAHSQEIAAHKATTEALAEAEKALRAAAIAKHLETGTKSPTPGVGVRVLTRLVYDPAEAIAWGQEHGLAVSLTLDKAAFEKIAKATPLPFVREKHTAQATIATDLSDVIAAGIS